MAEDQKQTELDVSSKDQSHSLWALSIGKKGDCRHCMQTLTSFLLLIHFEGWKIGLYRGWRVLGPLKVSMQEHLINDIVTT